MLSTEFGSQCGLVATTPDTTTTGTTAVVGLGFALTGIRLQPLKLIWVRSHRLGIALTESIQMATTSRTIADGPREPSSYRTGVLVSNGKRLQGRNGYIQTPVLKRLLPMSRVTGKPTKVTIVSRNVTLETIALCRNGSIVVVMKDGLIKANKQHECTSCHSSCGPNGGTIKH